MKTSASKIASAQVLQIVNDVLTSTCIKEDTSNAKPSGSADRRGRCDG